MKHLFIFIVLISTYMVGYNQCSPVGTESQTVIVPLLTNQNTASNQGVGSGASRIYDGFVAGNSYTLALNNGPGNLSCRQGRFLNASNGALGSWFNLSSSTTQISPAGTAKLIVATTRSSNWNSTSATLTYRMNRTITTPVSITGTVTAEDCPADNNGSISSVAINNAMGNGVQYIKLTQRRTSDNHINLRELQATEIFTGTNVALGATVTGKVGALGGYPYSNLTDNDFGNTTSGMAHTGGAAFGNWIQVNLGAEYNLDFVRIFNRTNCCTARANNLLIEYFDGSFNLLHSQVINATAASSDYNVLDVSWSDAGSTLNRTGLNAGTYTLSYSDIAGNSGSQAFTVGTANTLSVAPTSITGTNSICPGGSTTLTAAGGTLGTGATYEWYTDAGFTTNVGSGSSYVASPGSTQAYFVRAEGTCNNTSGAGITVTVETLSTAPSSASAVPTFICAGDPVALSLTGGSLGTGADYEWYSDAGFTTNVGSGSSISVNPTVNTTYYVRAEGNCNTTSGVNTVEVFVNGGSTAPTGASLNGATASSTCNVSGTSWHYFYTSSGDLLAAINPNGNNLGSVTVDITVGDDGPVGTGYAPGVCGSPGANGGEYVLARYWDISVATQPSSAVDVKFYYLGAELTTFQALVGAQNAAYLSCWGNVTGESDLMMTVDHTGGTQQLFNSISPIAGPGTDIREYQFSVSEFSGGKLHANGGIQGSNPLPVELLSWEANAVDNEYIALTWSTATEINNDGFEIERSIDGENFESIAWKAGRGNSTTIQNYSYEDYEATKGVRYYYRLKQIDNDGTSETFEVVSAMLTAKGESIIGNLIPNPSKENTFVRVAITSAIEEAVMVSIYNHVGARVASYRDKVFPGSNNLSININDLSSGTYFINFEGSFGRETRKLILIK